MVSVNIQSLVARYVEAFNRGDAASLAALFAEDAKFMPPYVPMVVGKRAIEQTVKNFRAMGVRDLSLKTVEVQEHGDVVIEVSAYQVTVPSSGSQPATEAGKDVRIWKQQDDGAYRLLVDIWNSNSPPAVS